MKIKIMQLRKTSLTELHPEGFSQAEKEEQYETH